MRHLRRAKSAKYVGRVRKIDRPCYAGFATRLGTTTAFRQRAAKVNVLVLDRRPSEVDPDLPVPLRAKVPAALQPCRLDPHRASGRGRNVPAGRRQGVCRVL